MTDRTRPAAPLLLLGVAALSVLAWGASPSRAARPHESPDASPHESPYASPHESSYESPHASAGQPAVRLTYEVVSRRAHDTAAWTQGLVLDATGRLFESTGRVGMSSLREVALESGDVIRQVAPPAEVFAEGLALVGDRLIQLTWRDGLAYAWDVESFGLLTTFAYAGEGWGLCFDGQRLVMSDGSSWLAFRDPLTFEGLGGVEVTLDGQPQVRLNELECVEGRVWANVWETDRIVRIDPATGRVEAILVADDLIEPHPAREDPGAVLNGIAFDPRAGTYLLTGKLWPELIEVRVLEMGLDVPGED